MITTFLRTDDTPERFCPCSAKNYLKRLTRGDAYALPELIAFELSARGESEAKQNNLNTARERNCN